MTFSVYIFKNKFIACRQVSPLVIKDISDSNISLTECGRLFPDFHSESVLI